MGFGQLAGDCQSQATAAPGPAARAVGAVKALEDVGERLGRDAGPAVMNGNPELIFTEIRSSHLQQQT